MTAEAIKLTEFALHYEAPVIQVDRDITQQMPAHPDATEFRLDKKTGTKTDVYETFKRMLARGQVPGSIEALLNASNQVWAAPL